MWFVKHRLMDQATGATDELGTGTTGTVASGAGANGQNGGGHAADQSAQIGSAASNSTDATTAGAQTGSDGASTTSTSETDWRSQYSGGDEKKAARLARYASPQAVVDALIAAQNRISSGELKSALPKNATPEQVAQWRVDNGIPDAPEKYDMTFDNGLVIGEADKPMVDGFLKAAHEANMNSDQAKRAVKWYLDQQKEMALSAAEQFKVTQQQTEDALRSEWGNDYRGNVNAIEGVLDAFLPAGDDTLRELVANGYKTNPGFAKFLAGVALQLNPAGTLIGANGGDLGASVDAEISKIEDVMKKDRPRYNADGAMQEKLRKLYAARASRPKAA